MGNFRVPTGIEEVASNVDTFGTYNWPESIRDFLVKKFNSIAEKHSKGFSLGYVNGFIHIVINVMDEHSRPRFTRWEGNFMYSEKEVNKVFADLKKTEIFPNFKAITEAEKMLIDNSSTHPQIEQLQIDLPRQSSPYVSSRPSSPTPSSPPTILTPSQIPTPYSPQRDATPSQFTTPSSPPIIATLSQIPTPSSPLRMPSPGQFPSTSHKEPFTVHLSNPPPTETPNWESVNEAITNLISWNKFLLNKVTSLESSNDFLTRRVAALEQAVFELKEANLKDDNVHKLMSEENPASLKPTQSACSEKSSSNNNVSPSSVVAPTVVEEEQENIQDVNNLLEPQTDKLKTNEEEGLADKPTGDSEEEELASTCKSGIARRVQLRHDRKRKFVSTSFTTGDRRRKKDKLPAKKRHKNWEFYDSLPKATHKAILPEVISHFYEETQNAYDEDICLWPTETIANVPTQANIVDCGMYVCKYMKTVSQLEQINWLDHTNWQDRMHIFRADFAYALLCTNMDLLTIT
ncbi:hypothetical protein M5K25_001115 [Dendrobium thyrsiflorum]|uniref:Ubiquitin-like protease family profile domain-containing protein n=1 Tax=Dendrobium thyrsiflorum TaxID=117978 RepID=A0ABD0W8V8_DENTH